MKLSTRYFNYIRDHKPCGLLPYYTLMVQRDHLNIYRVEERKLIWRHIMRSK